MCEWISDTLYKEWNLPNTDTLGIEVPLLVRCPDFRGCNVHNWVLGTIKCVLFIKVSSFQINLIKGFHGMCTVRGPTTTVFHVYLCTGCLSEIAAVCLWCLGHSNNAMFFSSRDRQCRHESFGRRREGGRERELEEGREGGREKRTFHPHTPHLEVSVFWDKVLF